MSQTFELTRVLIVVKTYPHPSANHLETVCTAGVTDHSEWVRLFPVPFRYLPPLQQYEKYQWIEIGLRPFGYGNDMRPESREPDCRTIRPLGEPLSTADGWRLRREVIDPLPHHTMEEFDDLYEKRRVSLGVVRPSRVLDVKVSEEDRDWSPKQKHALAQQPLFVERKALRKLPYRFHYVFQCSDSPDTYTKAIEDWELGTLFWKEVDRLGSERAAADSVRSKFLDELCREDKDTRFFMGTRHPFNEWLVLGVFWPPKSAGRQPRLFP